MAGVQTQGQMADAAATAATGLTVLMQTTAAEEDLVALKVERGATGVTAGPATAVSEAKVDMAALAKSGLVSVAAPVAVEAPAQAAPVVTEETAARRRKTDLLAL